MEILAHMNGVSSPRSIRVVREPELPPVREDERDWVRPVYQTMPPDTRCALPLPMWFECQMRAHESRSHEIEDLHDLISTSLNDVRCALITTRARTVRELIERGPTDYRGIRLDLVKVPENRRSFLASVLDEEAQYYLDLCTDLGKLAAWAILQHSEGAEHHGAETLVEYYDAEDAARNAISDFELETGGELF
jgi:hypothetical protein